MAAAGCFYAQFFLFVDAGIAYGPWISVEALLTAIIGGAGTVFGPLVGALAVKSLGEGAKLWTGDVPGLDLMIYGALLVIVDRVRAGAVSSALSRTSVNAPRAACGRRERERGGGPWLSRCSRSSACRAAFGGLLAVDAASLSAPAGRITALIGPNGAGKTTLFAIISGFLKPSAGRIRYGGEDVTGEPAHRMARRGIARTFQIVQPFAGIYGARQHSGRRVSAPRRARRRARRCRKGRTRGRPGRSARPAGAHLTVAGRKRLELARALATAAAAPSA